jgi:hypothetical protein
MRTVCVYHRIDLDGYMSAAIVKRWFFSEGELNKLKTIEDNDSHNIDFIGWNNGDAIPDLSMFDRVIMADISFPISEMLHLHQRLKSHFIWCDHHISAINDIDGEGLPKMITGLRDSTFAACELIWKYFFPNEDMPEIVRLLGRWDCTIDSELKLLPDGKQIIEFQYGARFHIKNYDDAYGYLDRNIEDGNKFALGFIKVEGKAIYDYLCVEAQQEYKKGFPIEFNISKNSKNALNWNYDYTLMTFKFICFNKERFNPANYGINYHADGYDGAACFWYENKQWKFSLYCDNGLVDCSVIAKLYEGGGHDYASGFVTQDISQFINQK